MCLQHIVNLFITVWGKSNYIIIPSLHICTIALDTKSASLLDSMSSSTNSSRIRIKKNIIACDIVLIGKHTVLVVPKAIYLFFLQLFCAFAKVIIYCFLIKWFISTQDTLVLTKYKTLAWIMS